MFLFSLVLSWGGVRPPPKPPRLCLAKPQRFPLFLFSRVLSWGGAARSAPQPPCLFFGEAGRFSSSLFSLVPSWGGCAPPTPPPMFRKARRFSLFLFSRVRVRGSSLAIFLLRGFGFRVRAHPPIIIFPKQRSIGVLT